MNIKEMLRVAADVPEVPFWCQLAAGISMAGAKILPEDLWDSVGKKLDEITEQTELDEIEVSGFTSEENHIRSEEHEAWIVDAIEEFARKNPGKMIWAIPVNELICLVQDDEEADDMVSITRLFFAGTEDELRAAISAWLLA